MMLNFINSTSLPFKRIFFFDNMSHSQNINIQINMIVTEVVSLFNSSPESATGMNKSLMNRTDTVGKSRETVVMLNFPFSSHEPSGSQDEFILYQCSGVRRQQMFKHLRNRLANQSQIAGGASLGTKGTSPILHYAIPPRPLI